MENMWLQYLLVGTVVLVAAVCLGYRLYIHLSGKGGCHCAPDKAGCLSNKECVFKKIVNHAKDEM